MFPSHPIISTSHCNHHTCRHTESITGIYFQEQGLSRFILHQFSQLLFHLTNYYINKHTETVFPRHVSGVAKVTSVTSTVTSTRTVTRRCSPQVYEVKILILFTKLRLWHLTTDPMIIGLDVRELIALVTWLHVYTHHDKDWQVCLHFICCDFFPLCVR